MEFCQVSLEAHRYSATIYVIGFLADTAAARTETLIDLLPSTTRTVRLDLRAVELIDPSAFVAIARALNRWRDAHRGRLAIEFPARSRRQAPRLYRDAPAGIHTIPALSPVTTGIFDERAARNAAC